jgi:dynein heavy chain
LKSEEIKQFVEGKPFLGQLNMPETVRGYLTEPAWRECKSLESIHEMSDLCENLDHDHLHWRKWFGEEKVEDLDLPKKYKDTKEFHKLMIIKVLRPDRVSLGPEDLRVQFHGPRFCGKSAVRHGGGVRGELGGHPHVLRAVPGVDPTKDVEEIGKVKGQTAFQRHFAEHLHGSGPGGAVIWRCCKECAEKGNWIFLQNVHLMQSWLKSFERKLEEVSVTAHAEFRCFISSEPPPLAEMKIIPEAILQRCIKISNEAPSDLKANMLRTLGKFSQAHIDKSSKPNEYKSILFALCYFHSVVLGGGSSARRPGPGSTTSTTAT